MYRRYIVLCFLFNGICVFNLVSNLKNNQNTIVTVIITTDIQLNGEWEGPNIWQLDQSEMTTMMIVVVADFQFLSLLLPAGIVQSAFISLSVSVLLFYKFQQCRTQVCLSFTVSLVIFHSRNVSLNYSIKF